MNTAVLSLHPWNQIDTHLTCCSRTRTSQKDKRSGACIAAAKLEIGTDNFKIAGSVFPGVHTFLTFSC